MAKLRCWNCGTALDDVPLPISRHATCSECFNELHCCRGCRHYQAQATGVQCDEDRADPPIVKESANFCDWFRPNPNAFSAQSAARGDHARSKLEELFGADSTDPVDSTPPTAQSQPDEARARLDALFEKNSPKNKM